MQLGLWQEISHLVGGDSLIRHLNVSDIAWIGIEGHGLKGPASHSAPMPYLNLAVDMSRVHF